MPSLPPEILLGHPTTRRRVRDFGGDDGLVIEADDDPRPGAPRTGPSILIGPPTSPAISALRLVFLTGLAISLFILLIAYLDENTQISSIARLAVDHLLPAPDPRLGPAARGR